MLRTRQFLLLSQLKRSKLADKTSGFTLIELLVAMILAALVITPLLGFMINIMRTDRNEQAKSTSEQEIQSALDYIARDLQQAVYIYDANGVERDSNADPAISGIRNQIPPAVPADGCTDAATCKPVLVFWKRRVLDKCDVIKGERVGKFTGGVANNNCGTIAAGDRKGDDAGVYSLVAYYLIKNDANNTWSNAARIGRVEIRGGIVNSIPGSTAGTARAEPTATGTSTVYYNLSPSLGFMSLGSAASPNQWQKHPTENYNDAPAGTQEQPEVEILVDYIDQSADNPFAQTCVAPQQVPSTGNITGGFYTCVNSEQNSAQVFMRGNAFARIQNNNIEYNHNKSTFFPTASIQVEGKSNLP